MRLEAGEECAARGNASELREVFVNLIVNALDAMPAGGRLTVGCRPEGAHVRVLFTDTGAGMTEEVRARVFEPFYTTKGAQGTGLGLFVSYGIIERHRGQIAVESDEGRGSTFAITLPRVACAVGAAPRAGRRSRGRAPPCACSLDDEEVVGAKRCPHDRGARTLRDSGRFGARGARLLDAAEFDVIFSDLSMPGMDGWELAREGAAAAPARASASSGYGKDTARPTPTATKDPPDAVHRQALHIRAVEETLARFQSIEAEGGSEEKGRGSGKRHSLPRPLSLSPPWLFTFRRARLRRPSPARRRVCGRPPDRTAR